jgi:hypothetical protein
MNKVFQIGFNKCATTSFFLLFGKTTRPSVKSIHWDVGRLAYKIHRNHLENKPLLTGYEEYTFFSDIEGPIDGDKNSPLIYAHKEYYKDLDKQYPDSKFILNTRNVYDWLESRKKHLNRKDYQIRSYFERCKFHYKLNDHQLVEKWLLEWEDHHNDVLNYFKNRPDDLLIYNIDHDNLDKIKKFFPEINFRCKEFPWSKKFKCY